MTDTYAEMQDDYARQGIVYGEDECWHHGVEPGWEIAYKVCGECSHAYMTEDILIKEDAVYRHWPSDVTSTRLVEDIWTCPMCAHDF